MGFVLPGLIVRWMGGIIGKAVGEARCWRQGDGVVLLRVAVDSGAGGVSGVSLLAALRTCGGVPSVVVGPAEKSMGEPTPIWPVYRLVALRGTEPGKNCADGGRELGAKQCEDRNHHVCENAEGTDGSQSPGPVSTCRSAGPKAYPAPSGA